MPAVSGSIPSVVARGEAIYKARYREEYERLHPGRFVAIDVASEKAFVGNTADEALDAAESVEPNGFFHLIKVGSPAAFRVGH